MPLVQGPQPDPTVPIEVQLTSETTGPVYVTNRCAVENTHRTEFLESWAAEAHYLKKQPGYIDARLFRGIGNSKVWFHIATWESVEALVAAGSSIEFRTLIAAYPPSASSSHLVQPVAVPGICLGI
ncbi:hypothetical protein ALI144C_13705 [Actinosynnema sp. ALI-1.44]|uniref:antibiotic biosynthesis monooxygenase family protein n=1 Tax=Actinosynnema sp. ALI-1.44 TaxID=1933779 RepID=UPI00097C477E|nr:antibiotic biosynthesis monooxygenase family protein [Actinosynnema sp. ALI-1.44]ONI85348.1 hypothetical protein ALI144C_13705 [Actinosynnema sp. ALI-1.44]